MDPRDIVFCMVVLGAVVICSVVIIYSQGTCQPTTFQLKDGDPCPDTLGYPPSTCKKHEHCTVLKDYINMKESLQACGFVTTNGAEMLCCPNSLPEQAKPILAAVLPKAHTPPTKDAASSALPSRAPATSARSLRPDEFTLSHLHLASFGYLSESQDDYVYHCAGVILSTNEVLTSRKCAENDPKPGRVTFGLKHTFGGGNDYSIKSKPKEVGKDLVIFSLRNSVDFSDIQVAIVANFCETSDMKENATLYAIGYSFDVQNGTNCGLFRSRLERAADCGSIDSDQRCLKGPVQDPELANGCINCLAAGASVLHVDRGNGSLCVAGIAKPTSDKCILSSASVVYNIFGSETIKNITSQTAFRHGG